MKRFILAAAGAAFLLASCGSGEGDVLATWKGEDLKSTAKYTRGEFYRTMGRRKQYILRNKSQQINMLRDQVFNKVLAQDSRLMNMHKTDKFKKDLEKSVEERLLLRFFLNKAYPRQGLKFSVPAHRIRHIVVRVPSKKKITEPDPDRFKLMDAAKKQIKDKKKLEARLNYLKNKTKVRYIDWPKAELDKLKAEKMKKIQLAAAEITAKKGKNFAEVAKKYGEDGTKSKGGDLGYLIEREQRMDKVFLDAAMKLKAGQVSGVVETPFGYHLIKCDEIVKITDGNIDDYYKDKRELGMARNKFWYATVWQYIDDTLKNDKFVKQYPERLAGTDPKSVVFEISAPNYKTTITLGDIDSKLKKSNPYLLRRFGINRDRNEKTPFTAEEKKKFFDWEVTMPVLRYGAYKKGYVGTDEFKQEVDALADSLLVQMRYKLIDDGIKVSDKEARDFYDKNKSRYMRRFRRNPKDNKSKLISVQRSFDEVKKSVIATLEGQKKRNEQAKLRNTLFRKYSVKLLTNELEVVKPEKPKKRAVPAARKGVKQVKKTAK